MSVRTSTPSEAAQPNRYTLLGPDRRFYQSTDRGSVGGHMRTRIYGSLDCPSALRAIERGSYAKNRVFFADESTAIAAGYRPCAVCRPEQYRVWKAAQKDHG
jgi:hypothetical protein